MNRMKAEGKLSRFLNGKGFYAALGICLIAIGISAWSGISAIKEGADTAEKSSDQNISSSYSSYESLPEQAVDTPQSDIPDTRSEENSSAQISSEKSAPIAKYFIYPVSGEIIKDFSNSELQYSLTYNDMRLHTGIDIAADVNTAVNSCGDGVVTFAGKDDSLGYTVKIDHGNGVTVVYAGLSEALKVKKGDTVAAGTNLGAIGVVTEECVDAPHLHLEFYQDETAVAPQTYLTTN